MADGNQNPQGQVPVPQQPVAPAPIKVGRGIPGGGQAQQTYNEQQNAYQKAITTNSYNSLNQNQHYALQSIYNNYPSAFKNPGMIMDLVKNTGPMQGVHIQDATNALKFMALYDKFNSTWYTGQNPTGATGQIWNAAKAGWSGLTTLKNWKNVGPEIVNLGTHTWDNFHNYITNGVHKYGLGGFFTHEGSVYGKSFVSAAGGLAKGIGGLVERAGKSIMELNGFGGVAGYEDLGKTLLNLGQNFNPWSDKNAYQMTAHVLAYYESMVKQKGIMYALGNIGPSLALIGATAGAGSAAVAGFDATAAAEAAATAAEEAAMATETGAAGFDMATTAANATKEIEAANAAQATQASKVFTIMQKLSEHGNPLGYMYRGAKGFTKMTGGARANALYQLVQAQAKHSDAKLWQQTGDLGVHDANGKPVDLGRATMEFFAGKQDQGVFFSASSGIVDLWAEFIGTDPVGALGTKISSARTVGLAPRLARRLDEFSHTAELAVERQTKLGKLIEKGGGSQTLGNLSVYFKGLGVTSGDTLRQLAVRPYVRRALTFMATHNSGEIGTMFKAGKQSNTFSPYVLKQLGDAKTEEEVLNILAPLADGQGLALVHAPSMGMYSWMRQTAADSILSKQSLLSADISIINRWKNTKWSKDGPDVKVDDPIWVGVVDAGLRARSSFRLWVAKQLAGKPMYYSSVLKGFETDRIIMEDANESIPAIRQLAIGAMMPREVVNAMTDYLTQALADGGTEAFSQAYREVVYHMVMRRAVSGLNRAEYDLVAKDLEGSIQEEIYRMLGFDGGSVKAHYGANGASDIGNIEDMEDIKGINSHAAIVDSQLSDMKIPQVRDLNNLSTFINETIIRMTNQIGNLHDINLSEDTVRALALDKGLEVSHTNKWHDPIHEMRLNRDTNAAHVSGLTAGRKQVTDAIKEIMEGPGKPHEKFAAAYKKVAEIQKSADLKVKEETRFLDDSYVNANEPVAKDLTKAGNTSTRQNVDYFRGVLNAAHDQMMSFNVLMLRDPGMGSDVKRLFSIKRLNKIGESKLTPEEWAVSRAGIKYDANEEKIQAQFVKEITAQRGTRSGLRTNWQVIVDGMNRSLSLVFVPLALLSGRWAMHVGVSEATLNALRVGGFNLFDARLAASIVRHENQTAVLMGRLKQQGDLKSITADLAKNVFHQDYKGASKSATTLLSHNRILIRNVTAGVLTGIEKSMIKGWDSEKLGRLVEDTAGVIMRHSGHLPLGVHAQNDVSITDPFSGLQGEITDVYRVDAANRLVKTKASVGDHHTYNNLHDHGYARSMVQQMVRLVDDKLSFAASKRLRELIEEPTISGMFGVKKGSLEWFNETRVRLSEEVYKDVLQMKPAELSRYRASELVISDPKLSAWSLDMREAIKDKGPDALVPGREAEGITYEMAFKEAALKDFATRTATNVLNTVTGTSSNKWRLHTDLLDMIIHNQIPTEKEMNAILGDKKLYAPKDIPGREVNAANWTTAASYKNFVRRLSEVGHEKVLGPIVNWMVRDPLFALEYHNQMELARELIKARQLNVDNAEVWAENQAIQRMIRFVHNPKDKTFFEANMRVAAPFYFAQNQAWRRAFRMGAVDMGAFEKYLKMSLGVTNYVAIQNQAGTSPKMVIPGTQWLGGMFGLDFNLTGGPGSVNSMVPTGDMGGIMGTLGTIVRPAFGPYVTTPLKLLKDLKFPHEEWANNIVKNIIGEYANNSTMQQNLLPSSTLNGMLQIMDDVVFKNHNGTVASVENQIITDLSEQMHKKFRDEVESYLSRSDKWNSYDKGTREHLIKSVSNTLFANWTADNAAQAKFLEEAHSKAVMMIATKTILNFFSPLALSLNATYSGLGDLDKIMAEKNKDGTPKYTAYEAMDEYNKRHPNNIYDLTAHTSSPYGHFDETKFTFDFVEQNMGFVNKYKYASAMIPDRTSPQDAHAASLEMRLGLRARMTPDEMIVQRDITTGNDWYYNDARFYMLQNPMYSYDGKTLNGEGIKVMGDMAKGYGKLNPSWYASFKGEEKNSNALKVYDEMNKMLQDPEVLGPLNGKGGKIIIPPEQYMQFVALNKIYDASASQINAEYKVNPSAASEMQNRLYETLLAVSKLKEFSLASYYITSCLLKMPTVFVPAR